MSTNALERGRAAFLEEATDLLEDLESSLLELEENPYDTELIGRIFRAIHTIKGSGGMFGFTKIETFTHDIETIFDKVRGGKLKVTQGLIDNTLSACDIISRMLAQADNEVDTELQREADEILKVFAAYAGGTEKKEDITSAEQEDVIQFEALSEKTFLIRIEPDLDIFENGTNLLLLLDELRDMGSAIVAVHTDKIPKLNKINPEKCYLYWDVLLCTKKGENDIRDVFIFVEDECKIDIKLLDAEGLIDPESAFPVLFRMIKEGKEITSKTIKNITKRNEQISPPIKDSASAENDETGRTILQRQERKRKEKDLAVTSIRVAAEKLDQLVNLVGELVIVQASLSQRVNITRDLELMPIAEEVERLTHHLRDTAMSIRMIPIGTLFSKFKRLVRDISRKQKKTVELRLEGTETELDKNVIEQLNDPLVHLIRNALDHGIETEALRMIAQKPKKGTITLSAFQAGADVVIQVKDDGAGIDTEKVRKKALEKGLISPKQVLTEKELYSLIFAPGFSTNEKVTSLSGRGVGMDVVKRNVEALRGNIDIESKKNKGTTISLKLPLTLGIIEGLIVQIADDSFVFPLSAVEECLELIRDEGDSENSNRFLNIRGHAVPYIRLREQLNINGTPPAIEEVLITKINGQRVGFAVDHIIGKQQIVIKTLGNMYRNVEGLSGATILGDGTVSLILDVQRLVNKVLEDKNKKLAFSCFENEG
ncbi:chemotaxis protein CheA [candidate division KSB1 bacterium]|nr:MAG: chemotaxis protein CheA [candidate division KSB1 bacterium]